MNLADMNHPGQITPTSTFDDTLSASVGGLDLTFIHSPGESKDQTMVWWAKERALFCADNFYKSFPNLYALRGQTRSVSCDINA